MTRQACLFLFLCISILTSPLEAQTYDAMWKNVEMWQKKDLPKSAWMEARKVYEKAERERNVPQMIKAFWMSMELRATFSDDSLTIDKKKLLEWAEHTENIVDQSVLYALWSSIIIAEDVRSGFEKAMLALKHADALKAVSAASYAPLTKSGKTSEAYFRNNLYDLLARYLLDQLKNRAWTASQDGNQTERLPTNIHNLRDFMNTPFPLASPCDVKAGILHIYQSLLKMYDNEEERAAWILTALDAMAYLQETYRSFMTDEERDAQYKTWIRQYLAIKTVPEVYIAYGRDGRFREDNPAECLAMVREGIRKYPDYTNVNELKNIEKEILNPALSIRISSACPGEMRKLNIRYKNLTGVTIQTYRINLSPDSPVWRKGQKEVLSKHAHLVKETPVALKAANDYRFHNADVHFRMPECGIYYLKALPDGKRWVELDGTFLYITGMRIISCPLPNGEQELVVLDAKSGHPVKDALVSIYENDYAKGFVRLKDYPTDEQGTVRLSDLDGQRWFHARRVGDEWMEIASLWSARYEKPTDEERAYLAQLFTDRALYRPGQTVFVSGICYTQLKDETKAKENASVTLTLRDANGKEVRKVKATTNVFGSFGEQFILPVGGFTGRFTIEAELEKTRASTDFQVEAYKRPTFEVAFEKVKSSYGVNDSIRVEGVARTFVGFPLQRAEVRYTVERRTAAFWARRHSEVTARWEGDTETDGEGKFFVPVELSVEDEDVDRFYYNYEVTAEITSVTGETRRGSIRIPLWSSSMRLRIEGLDTDEVYKEKLPERIAFTARNLLNEPVATNVRYELIRIEELSEEEKVQRVRQPIVPSAEEPEQFKEVQRILDGEWPANEPIDLENRTDEMSCGWYRLRITAKDDKGRECTATRDFLLLSLNDEKLPVARTDWYYMDGVEFGEKNPTLYIGTTEKEVYLLYDVFAGNRRVESRRLILSDQIVKFSYPYKEVYGEGIFISWAFVRNGDLYRHQSTLVRPKPDKELKLKWTSFRDKLTPGQREEWRLRVVAPDGKPAHAELLAMMYDASLDRLKTNRVHFDLRFNRPVPFTSWRMKQEHGGAMEAYYAYRTLSYPGLEYSSFFHASFGSFQGAEMELKAVAVGQLNRHDSGKTSRPGRSLQALSMDVASDEVPESRGAASGGEETEAKEVRLDASVSMRENFDETAFFYPQLRTDENGEVSIAFTLPESLTEWKFVGLAHTADMNYGMLYSSVTAAKDFMLQVHMPRFVRIGDRVHIAAQVTNTGGKPVDGKVRLELFDPQTDNTFYTDSKPFGVRMEKSVPVDFFFEVTDKHPVMAVRIFAEGNGFSDGEQHLLPVLTDKERMTETVPLHIHGKGTKTFSLTNLFNRHSKSVTQKQMTVELTADPVWYAVLALPTLSNPQNESAVSWAAAYYANTLAKHIVDTHPRIRQVFDSWKAQESDDDHFMGRLQQNQDLKNLLLEETPWVTAAENEGEQRRRLTALFDINRMANRLTADEEKLKALQKSDGGWSWFEGMESNRYITTEVMEMLSRLRTITGRPYSDSMKRLMDRALAYLDKEAHEEYRSMLKQEREYPKPDRIPSETAVRYLYIRALCRRSSTLSQPDEDKAMVGYFLDRIAARPASFTVYGKAVGAVVLYDYGRVAEAEVFLQSLMEYAVATDEMGRYYDARKAYYSWCSYRMPTEVAAIEAIDRISKDRQAIQEMQRWILKQKQTQCWATPIASVNAIYALLNREENDWPTYAGDVKVKIGETVVRTPTDDALGYVRREVATNDVDADRAVIEKNDEGISWGAVYAQYVADMREVRSQGEALTVRRELVKDGRPVDGATDLHVGDRLTVRLTVTADRDMDFVQIKDSRAACMEPLDVLSGYRWNNGWGVYQSTKDASTLFYADKMPKGTYTLEYQVYLTRAGKYLAGVAAIQSAYAPEFGGHGDALTIEVK